MIQKIRYIIDTIMLLLMIILMGYNVTGCLWHEILGISIFVLFIIHSILNYKWFINLSKIIKNSIKKPNKVLWVICDLLLLVDMILLAISSVMISKKVFVPLNISWSYTWSYIHTVCAYMGIIIMSIHLGFHWKSILSSIKKSLCIKGESKVRTTLSRIIALILAIFGVISSFERGIVGKFIYSSNSQKTEKSTKVSVISNKANNFSERKHKKERGTDSDDGATVEEEPINEGESLNDYLSRLVCNGCGRQCPLISPGCGTGQSNAEVATEYYNTHTSSTSSSDMSDKATIKSTITIEDESIWSLFADYIPITALYVGITYYSLEFIHKNKTKDKGKEDIVSNK